MWLQPVFHTIWAIAQYALPFFPLVTRLCVVIRFRPVMGATLSEAEADVSEHRALILPMAGFSFTAALGLGLFELTHEFELRLPLYYLLVSFLSYILALNIQGYKFVRWHDQMGNASMEIGSLGLILALVSIVLIKYWGVAFGWSIAMMATAVWLVDHGRRLSLSWDFLRNLEKGNSDG